MSRRTPPRLKNKYWEGRYAGLSITAAAKRAGISTATGRRFEKTTLAAHEMAVPDLPATPDPVMSDDLCFEAKQALTTFVYFQRRYFGRIAIGWQIEAAEKMVELLQTPTKEYVVVNAPPGSGKSALFTHDFCAWVTVRNRAIRGQIGSLTMGKARDYLRRLKTSLERTLPQPAEENDLLRGLAYEAEAALAVDYGRFKPMGRDSNLWSRTAFIVVQRDGRASAEKEATWSAYGKDSGFLGARQDLVIWDDLMDPSIIRTATARDELKEWWGDIAETRLEPGGLLILQGQRMGADDLYRHALDERAVEFDDEGEEIPGSESKKYHHIIFKAHYETRCRPPDTHRLRAPSYPEGCLINPGRLPWRELAMWQENRADRYLVLYQQEDADPAEMLVQPDWIWGHNGHPGCIDWDRKLRQVPEGLGHCLSVVTCDPSPTNRWGIIWWLVQPDTKIRYLIDIFNDKMEAPELLDYRRELGIYTGLMDEWQRRSVDLGIPITHWVVEINAAQRFMLQYEHVREWINLTRVQLLPHTTGRNKSDPLLGVETIAPNFEYGRCRLPYAETCKTKVIRLINELTKYGQIRSDDLVMATWFLDWNLPNLRSQRKIFRPAARPSWMLREKVRVG